YSRVRSKWRSVSRRARSITRLAGSGIISISTSTTGPREIDTYYRCHMECGDLSPRLDIWDTRQSKISKSGDKSPPSKFARQTQRVRTALDFSCASPYSSAFYAVVFGTNENV